MWRSFWNASVCFTHIHTHMHMCNGVTFLKDCLNHLRMFLSITIITYLITKHCHNLSNDIFCFYWCSNGTFYNQWHLFWWVTVSTQKTLAIVISIWVEVNVSTLLKVMVLRPLILESSVLKEYFAFATSIQIHQ